MDKYTDRYESVVVVVVVDVVVVVVAVTQHVECSHSL